MHITAKKTLKQGNPNKSGSLDKQGPFEKAFRKITIHLIGHSQNPIDVLNHYRLKEAFKVIILHLFLKTHSTNKVIANRKDIKELLVDKIWEEFYDIAKNKDIETAICIIFKRYEK